MQTKLLSSAERWSQKMGGSMQPESSTTNVTVPSAATGFRRLLPKEPEPVGCKSFFLYFLDGMLHMYTKVNVKPEFMNRLSIKPVQSVPLNIPQSSSMGIIDCLLQINYFCKVIFISYFGPCQFSQRI